MNKFVFFAILGAACAPGSTISFVGNLRTDANVTGCGTSCTLDGSNTDGDYAQWAAVVDDFTVLSTSQMQAITFSYGGGINGAGDTIAESGFEPYLSLFDASGNFLASTALSGCPAGGQINSVSGQCYDVELDGGTLAPGTYQIAISAFDTLSFAENLGTGTLADGFTGLGNLASGEDLHYAFDVELTSTASTPEPSSGFLASGILAMFAWRSFRARRRN